MAFQYSPEQQAIFQVRNGGVIVVANAGTGKTTSTAELIVLCYLLAERSLFPRLGDKHATGRDQIRILRQFLCVTFTVKAAHELDERIKKLFKARGIDVPKNADGSDFRIARTLDSFLQSWLRKRKVFDAWMEVEPDTCARIDAALPLLAPETRAILAPQHGADARHALSIKWPWLPQGEVATMLLDLILRYHRKAPLEGCEINRWADEFDEYLATIRVEDGKVQHTFWDGPLATWKKHQRGFSDLDHALMQQKPLPEGVCPEHAKGIVETWAKFNALRDEFLSVHELARSRGFHPEFCPEKASASSVEEQLAGCVQLQGYKDFLTIATLWHRIKTHFMLREFGDQTTAFVRACETHGELLERTREFPTILRTKYVFWDEVQDNSDFQHRILRLFYATGEVPYLSVAIGDPKQQIYCWRGASPRGFLDMIEKKRAKDPDRLLSLTCSFRSARKIVALGNEIITTLPSYREKVHPSSTIFKEEGRIEVSAPLLTVEDEAAWVLARIEHAIAKTSDSIMVVSRTDVADHPLVYRYLKDHPEMGKRIQCLTIHRSKGLEADMVFVLGLVAGKLPDPRANSDEEVNLFYVACTRARHTLCLSGLIAKREVNDAGKIEETAVGPSPYFFKLPSLRALCLASGWTEGLLRTGVSEHGGAVAGYLSRIQEKRAGLIKERREVFPRIELPDEARPASADYGAVLPGQGMSDLTSMEMAKPEPPKRTVSVAHRDRLLKKLIAAEKLTGRLPRLGSDDFQLAMRSGWIHKAEGEKYWSFSPAWSVIVQNATSSAA